jgi:hypothetical protein
MKRKGKVIDDHTSTHWHGNRFAPPLQIVLVITRRSPSPPHPHDSAGRGVASSSFRRRFVYIPRDFEFVPDSSDIIIWTRGVLPWPVLTQSLKLEPRVRKSVIVVVATGLGRDALGSLIQHNLDIDNRDVTDVVVITVPGLSALNSCASGAVASWRRTSFNLLSMFLTHCHGL